MEPHITSLKEPDFPSVPDAFSESEYDSDSDASDQFPPAFKGEPSTISPINPDGAGNIFEILNFFHNEEMLGHALKNNVTHTMRKKNIDANLVHDIFSDVDSGDDGTPGLDDAIVEETGGGHPPDMESDDGADDTSESTVEIEVGQNILAFMHQGGADRSSKSSKQPTKKQVDELKVLIEQRKARQSFSLESSPPYNSIPKLASLGLNSRFSMSQSMTTGDDFMLTPIHQPKVTRRETGFLITQGLKNNIPLPQEALDDLADDPTMWLLSDRITSNIKTTGDVARIMQHVESTINLIEGYIPNIGEMLKDERSATAYITNVIQELLKRAQGEGLLKGVQQDWARWKGADLGSVAQRDIRKMVQAMAWTRNNIRAANVTDANDAKMACGGATEVKSTLKRLMSQTLSSRHIIYEDVEIEPEPILSDPLYDKLDESEIHE